MAPVPPVPRPTWTRRVAAWSVLMFFVSLIVLTYFAVYYSNRGNHEMAGYLAGLASVVPLLFVIVPYYATPIWAIGVPLSVEDVARALAQATTGLPAEPVAEREGSFARCVSVVRFGEPACTVGWYGMSFASVPAPGTPTVTVVLRPHTRDREALAAFRETLARSLLDAGTAAA